MFMVPDFPAKTRQIFYKFMLPLLQIDKYFLFQIGKDFACLAVTMVLERQSERDCGYAAA